MDTEKVLAQIKRMEYPWITCLEVDGAIIHKEVLE